MHSRRVEGVGYHEHVYTSFMLVRTCLLLLYIVKEPLQTFSLMFLLIIWIKKSIVSFLLIRKVILFLVYILAVGNTHYGKRPTSRYICYDSAVYHKRKLTFTAIFLVLLTDQFDAIFNPKNASETNDINNTSPTSKTYEFSRHRYCLTLNFGDNANHSQSDRCQPLTDCLAQATPRSLRGRGCRMTTIQA